MIAIPAGAGASVVLASLGVGVISFTIVSRYFLRNPSILWSREIANRPRLKQVEAWDKPFVFSHRGGREEEVENSFEAFVHSATKIPEVMLETDAYLTKDDKVVLFHDEDMERMCGVKGKIRDFNFDELPALIPSAVVKANNPRTTARVTKIPLLEDLFRAFPNHVIYVECKPPVKELVPAVHELINKYDRKDRTVWGSLGYTWMSELCYATDPTIPLYTVRGNILKYWAAYLFGILPFLPIKETTILVFDTHGIKNHFFRVALNMMQPGFIRHLKERGIITQAIGSVAATNDENGWERSEKAGCDGICTDVPAKMWLYYAKKRGLM
ncbi:PLC-like phosphodiesterase [Gonapodya prolifera JEL478]|uniref:PLC-like phosphodiesterase n=1 Tax=Gonapodya prolifera (strain JEL478) TaxID=1344416 RepID=A0A139AS62_GONPJ|nr:PLC-like phosphodiesterase [Gonapodya prolifera JEL478]|eukprot:KXS19305.1 PLC-like phosphodiesterase [Gonapodya prolifera JEL478]